MPDALVGFLFFAGLFGSIGLALAWFIEEWRPHFMLVRHGRALRMLNVDQGRCRDCSSYGEAAVTDCGRCWEHCPRCARSEARKPETRTAALQREIAALEAQS